MFDKLKFSQILNNINNTYATMTEFSEKSGVNRTYLSQYINHKLNNPPSPKILEKIANSSNGITTYNELMQICGYIFITELTNTSFGIKPEYWEMIFGNVDKVGLSTKGATFLASLFDKGIQEAKKAKENNDNIFTLDLDSELLIPNTTNFDDMIEYTKIFCFFVCSILVTMSIDETEKEQLILNVQELLSTLPKSSLHKIDNDVSKKCYMVPIVGKIAAGKPILADEYIEGYLPIDPNLMGIINPEQCFFLRVKGESMNQLIKNGAYALIRKQDMVENGEIAVVLVNGDEATLKKFTQHGDVIVLEPMSDDPNFKTQIYDKNTRIQILGKYIGKFEMKK